MRDKTLSEMKSLSDTSDPDEHDRPSHAASGSSPQVCEEDLIDLRNHPNRKTMEPTQGDVECSSLGDEQPSKAKSFITSHVIGLLPFTRGSSQRPHVTKTEQPVQDSRELEERIRAWQKTCARVSEERRDAVNKNKQLVSMLKNEEREHEATKAAAQQERERLESKLKSARASSENTRRALKDAENEITRLRSEIDNAKQDFETAQNNAFEEMSRLASETDIANEERFKEKSAARKDIAHLQSQIKILNEKNDKFRQMLIPVSEKQVPDAEVLQKFSSLRSSMLALVRRTWKLSFRDDVDLISLSQDQIYIFKAGETCNYDRLRYAIFFFVHNRILGTQNYFLENDFEETDQRLQLVEQQLIEKSPVENRKLVMEWRSASFKATECFRSSGRVLSRETQDQIWNFFSPIQTASPAAEQFGRKKLEEICDAAVDLSLVIRQLKDCFWVDDMRKAVGRPLSEWDHLAEEMASVAAGKGKQPGTIAYVIVGALVKNPRENLEKVLVLEKAEVAVYH